jgi:hypothetical protein
MIDNCFLNNINGTQKFEFLSIGKHMYFVRDHSDHLHRYSQTDIKSMLGFFVDNIYQVFQQRVGIPMGTNQAPFWQT